MRIREGYSGGMSSELTSDGNVTVSTNSRMVGSSADLLPKGGVFERVDTPTGTLDGLNDDTLVSGPSIPGDQMRLSQAVAAGYVVRRPDGTYTFPDGSRQAPGAPQEAQESPQESDPGEGLGGERIASEESLAALAGLADGQTALQAVDQIIAGGDLSDDIVNRVAGTGGMEATALRGQVGQIVADFETQARTVVQRSGLDPEAVFEWAHENQPDLMRDAMKSHATQRTTSGYDKVTQAYLENLDTIDPEAILGASFANGATAFRHTDGSVILKDHMGRTFKWRDAVRNGLVSVKAGR